MIRLFREWWASQALDDPHPREVHGRMGRVHEALLRGRGMVQRPTPEGLGPHTLASLTHRRPAPPLPSRRWMPAAGMAAAAGLAILAWTLGPNIAPRPRASPPLAQRPVTPREPPAAAARAPRWWEELPRPAGELLQVSLRAPVEAEARQLLADARRAADLLILQRLPVLPNPGEPGP